MPVIKCVRKIEYVRVRLRLTHQRCLELPNFDVCNGVTIFQAFISLSRIESSVILALFHSSVYFGVPAGRHQVTPRGRSAQWVSMKTGDEVIVILHTSLFWWNRECPLVSINIIFTFVLLLFIVFQAMAERLPVTVDKFEGLLKLAEMYDIPHVRDECQRVACPRRLVSLRSWALKTV